MADEITLADDEIFSAVPAELIPYGRADAADYWSSEEDLMAKLRKRVQDPSVLTEFPPYFWGARISNGKLDSYFTRMHESSQDNYAADAEAGVAVMDSHNTGGFLSSGQLNFGRSLTGVRAKAKPKDPYSGEVFSQAYTLRGMPLAQGGTTDAYIVGIRSGIHRDVSVGFSKGQQICSICQKDMYRDFSCWHYPGMYYTVTDNASGEEGRRELCWASVENAHLREWSMVYKGATPQAAVVKAQRRLAAGETDWRTALELENLYGVRFEGVRSLFIPTDVRAKLEAERQIPPKAKEDPMDPAEILAQVRTLLSGIPGRSPVAEGGELDALRALIGNQQELAETAKGGATELGAARAEVERLKPFEAQATELRTALVEDVIAEGIRSDAKFPSDAMRRAYGHFTVEELKAERSRLREAATASLPAGRKSHDGKDEQAQTVEVRAPAAAYSR